jgi:integrase
MKRKQFTEEQIIGILRMHAARTSEILGARWNEMDLVRSIWTVPVHGFRSTFRDWVSEATAYPREVAEMALAHVNKDKTEAAYARSDLFDKRADLLAEWAAHCAESGADKARGGGRKKRSKSVDR